MNDDGEKKDDKTTLRDLRVSPLHDLEPGAVLARRYRILGPAGAGGMGAVYEAEQIELRRRVAIKLVRGGEGESFERLRREALGASAVQSPHVVSVFDFHWEEGEPPFLVMELLEGRSLDELLEEAGALPFGRAARLACQVLDGLAAAHRAGLVHRDVKPANIWLVPTMTGDLVKLLDFGLVKNVDVDDAIGLTARSGRLMGTRAYLAPEQIHRLPADTRSDLHAVGVVLWEMIAGRRLWDSRGPDVFAEIAARTPESLAKVVPGVPRGLADAVARALAKDPEGRFRDAAAMYAAIAPYASEARASELPPERDEAPETVEVALDRLPPRTVHFPPRSEGKPPDTPKMKMDRTTRMPQHPTPLMVVSTPPSQPHVPSQSGSMPFPPSTGRAPPPATAPVPAPPSSRAVAIALALVIAVLLVLLVAAIAWVRSRR